MTSLAASVDTARTRPIVECRGVGRAFTVTKRFSGSQLRIQAVRDINLEIRSGEVLAITGESGCGKSTLAKLILGVLPASQGSILFDGRPIQDIDRRTRGSQIQAVFQDPYTSLNPCKTVSQIIGLPLVVHQSQTRKERKRRIEELVELCGLRRRLLHAYPSQLSGGERQRVAIARTLAANPRVVILDEPTSALDVSVQAQILKLLTFLKNEFQLTYLLISHNLAVLEQLSDRVAVMYLGRIVELGATGRLFSSPMHPYTRALLDYGLEHVPRKDSRRISLEIDFPDPFDPPSGCHFHPRCPESTAACRLHAPATLRQGEDLVECFLYVD